MDTKKPNIQLNYCKLLPKYYIPKMLLILMFLNLNFIVFRKKPQYFTCSEKKLEEFFNE